MISRWSSILLNLKSITALQASLLVFALAFATRILFSILLVRADAQAGLNTTAEMELMAASFVRDGVLGNPYICETGASAHTAPLWPMAISAIYSLFGIGTPAARAALYVLGSALTAAAISLLPLVSDKLGLSRLAGWGAALFLAAFPMMSKPELFANWEQPLAGLLLILLLLQIVQLRTEQWLNPRRVLVIAALTALAAVAAPSLLPAVALMLIAAAICLADDRKRALGGIAIVAIATLVAMMPWTIRNQLVLGEAVATRSNLGLELALGNHASSTGLTMVDVLDDNRHPHVNRPECDRLAAIGELSYMRERGQEAFAWMANNPIRFISLSASRVANFWMPDARIFYGGKSFIAVPRTAILSAIGVLTFVCLVLLAARRDPLFWIVAAAAIGPTLIYTITHVDIRYRVPVHPLTTLLAVEALVMAAALVRARFGSKEAAIAKSKPRR